jgi:hypothetical protein
VLLVLQVKEQTEWRMKDVSQRVRILLSAPTDDDDDDSNNVGEWRYYVELPAEGCHRNHLTNEDSEVLSLLISF